MSKTTKEIAEEIGVSKQAVFKKMKREPLSTGLQGLTTTVDGRLIVSVDGLVDEPSTKSEEKTAEVDGQNRLYEILERELQAKNEQIVALQAELSKERQHSREQAERIAVLADQAQRLQLAQMQPQQIEDCVAPAEPERQQPEPPRSWWSRFWSK